MAYTQEEINDIFDLIIKNIEVHGYSLRKSLANGKDMPSSKTFYGWLENDEEKVKRYARACENRQDNIFDEILEIADEKNVDVEFDKNMNPIINGEAVQRSRLRIDARKWALAKMNPKKYGDKIEHTGDVGMNHTIVSLGSGVKPPEE